MTEPARPAPTLPPDIADWCELAEANATADVVAAAQSDPADESGARVGDADGLPLVASTALDTAFFNRIVGLGIGRPATDAQLDAALAFYEALGQANVGVSLAPQAQPADLPQRLIARGFRKSRNWVKCWHSLESIPDLSTTLRIEAIDVDRADDFVSIVIGVFEMPPAVAAAVRGLVGRPGWMAYLGYDGDRAVSAAALRIAGDVAWVGFGTTLPEARGRGGQSAMFVRRLQDARAAGCRLAITETGEDLPDDPNPSFHNMLRAGFQVAYLRPNYVRP